MKLVEVLEKFSNVNGVTGREDQVRNLLENYLKPYVDEIKEDKLGNLIGFKKGKADAPTVMIAAHMDEVGLMIKNIKKKGFLQFTKIGGIDDRVLFAQKVIVHTEKGPLVGVVGAKPVHIQKDEERKKVIDADHLFIDIGAKDKEEAEKMGVQVGDVVSFDIQFGKLNKNVVLGKAFDDRVGCAILVEVMKQLQDCDCNVYVVGTIQEEVGLRGATIAAFSIQPDLGLAVDVTVAGDTPGVVEGDAPAKMGGGPALTVADAGLITHPKVLRLLIDSAKENKISYQLETGIRGCTDAAKIALTRDGVPSGVVSVPARYIHSPAGIINLDDVQKTVDLLVCVVKNVPKHF
ncbi:MAG: M42 family metallopeptidase [Candidatus Bathyarchaeota archaeon]|nr:MAG: M42 family metallopeptidase [Candidatus Bathyarchaeum tardum]WNZ28322.1 MAG: M42 family metallopeptidase [Candidatus Bathyarchaeota archaeon]